MTPLKKGRFQKVDAARALGTKILTLNVHFLGMSHKIAPVRRVSPVC